MQLGNFAEWVAGVGTVAAFGGTLVVIHRDHQRRLEEHEEHLWGRAQQVDGAVTPASSLPDSEGHIQPSIRATINNFGPRPIRDVTMMLIRRNDGGVESQHQWYNVPAETSTSFQIPWRDELKLPFSQGGGVALDWTITFSDVAGREWRRTSDRSLVLLGSLQTGHRRLWRR